MTDEEVVRLSTLVTEHERRLNAIEGHLSSIENSLNGIRIDFNRHASEMVERIATFTVAVKIAAAVSGTILAALVAVVAKLVGG